MGSTMEYMQEIRRRIHRRPELSGQEQETGRLVAAELTSLELEVRTGIADTGVVGVLRGGRPGRTVLWRADMDALPIQENTGLPYASEVPGVMHACGHDCHVAVGLGLARNLAAHREELPGTVVFVFQPAEEAEGGADQMIAQGVLEDPPVEMALAYHVTMEWDTGQVLLSPGPTGAGCLDFEAEILGRSAHGAHPANGIDPIPAAAQVVTALHGLRSRVLSGSEPAVLTIGRIEGGVRSNVLAERVRLEGTIRGLSGATLERLADAAEQAVCSIGAAWGAEGRFRRTSLIPPVISHPAITETVRQAAREEELQVETIPPSMGAEDMARFLELVPGCLFRVGARNEAQGCRGPHHSPGFNPDEGHLAVAFRVGRRAIRKLLES